MGFLNERNGLWTHMTSSYLHSRLGQQCSLLISSQAHLVQTQRDNTIDILYSMRMCWPGTSGLCRCRA